MLFLWVFSVLGVSAAQDAILAAYLAAYDPTAIAKKGPSCQICRRALITGHQDNPLVTCLARHGKTTDLIRFLRPYAPEVFRDARRCPDYEEGG